MSRHDKVTLVPMGRRGCGKDYSTGRIVQILNRLHLSTQTADFGEELRREVAAGTQLGKSIAHHLASGQLVPDKQVQYVMRHVYRRCMSHNPDVIIVSGFPRTVGQAKLFLDSIAVGRRFGFFIDRPSEVCIARALKRKRPDDTEELLRAGHERFDLFERPAMEFLMENGVRFTHVTPGEGDLDPHIPNIIKNFKILQHFGISEKELRKAAA